MPTWECSRVSLVLNFGTARMVFQIPASRSSPLVNETIPTEFMAFVPLK
jgi:hypothetical protein